MGLPRNHVCRHLGIPITPLSQWVARHVHKPYERFRSDKRPPYEGYQDRRSGWYRMNHNKHVRSSDNG